MAISSAVPGPVPTEAYSVVYHPGEDWVLHEEPVFEECEIEQNAAKEILQEIRHHRWLFTSSRHDVREDAPVVGRGSAPVSSTHTVDWRGYYQTRLQSPRARECVNTLLVLPSNGTSTLAELLSAALERFAVQAHQALVERHYGSFAMPEDDRNLLVGEAAESWKAVVQAGQMNPETDLSMVLEAYKCSKKRPVAEQTWMAACIRVVVGTCVDLMEKEKQEQWRQKLRMRIETSPEVYSSVDVRSWPEVLQLAGAETDFSILDSEAFKNQVDFQLLAVTTNYVDGLKEAAPLIAKLRQQDIFGSAEIRDLFNDCRNLSRTDRENLLLAVLKDAPRVLIQNVIHDIDIKDTDNSEKWDEEAGMVKRLIEKTGEDIRCAPNAYHIMIKTWINGWGGVGGCSDELRPDQVCDHIEDLHGGKRHDNFEDLLKAAVSKLLRADRKFEAAQMLARERSKGSRVFETNRNDKQIAYLVSLFQDEPEKENKFKPSEDFSLALPCTWKDVRFVQECGENIDQLEQDLLDNYYEHDGHRYPVAKTLGLSWFWRCFDPKMDHWASATYLAITYDDSFYMVDFLSAEEEPGSDDEIRIKDVVRRILSSSHLLKVVHDVNNNALDVLNRAVNTKAALMDRTSEPLQISPMLDFTLVHALVRGSRPGLSGSLPSTIFNFLRVDMCPDEALSNFETTNLRKSQAHYMLTLAWCPAMILKIFVAFGIVTDEQVAELGIVATAGSMPNTWDRSLRNVRFIGRGQEEADPSSILPGPNTSRNLWTGTDQEAEEWFRNLPRPHAGLDVRYALRELSHLLLNDTHKAWARHALIGACQKETVTRQLDALYAAIGEQ